MALYQDPQVEEILLRFQNLRSKPARRAVYVVFFGEGGIRRVYTPKLTALL